MFVTYHSGSYRFGEDQNRARTDHAAENPATLRRLALNLLKKDDTRKSSLRGKILRAGWDNGFLANLLKI